MTLAKLADGTAKSAVAGFSRVLNRIDAQKRLSMTYDQGKEMAAHVTLSDRTGIKVYFADPRREPEAPSPRRLPVGAQNLCSAVVTVVVLDT